jgi:hypothetical protein
VYAGAAREAVFSVPAVIRRVNADFVPLALRAPLVNGAQAIGDEDEKWIYERINRAKLAPQGICVLDSSGQVLAWVQMFDSNQDALDFLDHACKRYQDNAAAKPPAVTEQYMKYPSDKVKEFQDATRLPTAAEGHPKGKTCPSKNAKGRVAPGSLLAQLVGRALDDSGKPVADVVNQEHYAEDKFLIAPRMQQAVAQALAAAGKERVPLPDEFGKTIATYAHLGHIDVRPLFSVGGFQNKGEWKQCKFWAEKVDGGPEKAVWRLEGQSEVVSALAINGKGVHNVKLNWEGFLTMTGNRMSQLLLSARGTEKLDFANDDHPLKKVKKDEVAFLPAGRPIDVDGGVRYGILGEPVAADEAEDKAPAKAAGPAPAADAPQPIPDEARKQLVEALGGGPFLVFRDKVQEELKLSDEQKQKLLEKFPDHVQETMKLFEKIQELKSPEREKAMQEHRQKSEQKLMTQLKDVLDAQQQERLFQLQLQQAGVFALLGQHEAFRKLKITDEQREKFREVVQAMEKKIQPLVKEAESGGNPQEVMPKVMKVRKEHESLIEALLSDTQKKQWQELLGKPFMLGD